MKKYLVAAILGAAFVTPSIAQTAPKPTTNADQSAPATLDNVVDALQRTNKLTNTISVDVTAIRAAVTTIPRKSAIYVDFSRSPIHIPSPSGTADTVAKTWCVSINYAGAKVVWSNGDSLLAFVCYD